jgi:hypothetical protein
MTILIYGSHGEIDADPLTGAVTAYRPAIDTELDYDDIARIDIDEWRAAYPGETLVTGDILDFGFWTKDGRYVAHDEAFRDDWRRCGIKNAVVVRP